MNQKPEEPECIKDFRTTCFGGGAPPTSLFVRRIEPGEIAAHGKAYRACEIAAAQIRAYPPAFPLPQNLVNTTQST